MPWCPFRKKLTPKKTWPSFFQPTTAWWWIMPGGLYSCMMVDLRKIAGSRFVCLAIGLWIERYRVDGLRYKVGHSRWVLYSILVLKLLFLVAKFFGIVVDPYLSKLQRNLSGRSTFFVWVEWSILIMTERSDIRQSSIFILQSSIPACPG